ncbi:DUF5999 family protein [Streptomyces sp. NPDC056549]|uniref:DUF5999 family protein n=1 Tax=Streptomyces sp. NPDC056549 TaxID=3345864 RepID=UPI0036793E14
MYKHQPTCPSAASPDREAAHRVVQHPDEGCGLLCNRVLFFDDIGELLPHGEIVTPRRALPLEVAV